MKAHAAAMAAVAATGVYGQTLSASPTASSSAALLSSASISYLTVTYDDCSSASTQSMITVTNGVTVTYCPECETQTSQSQQPGHTTVYTTVYQSLCPTGLVPATYTVTESCTETTPTWTPGTSHIPQGYTVTVKQCTVCDTTPVPVTITEPCGCEANEGTMMPNTNTGTTPTGTGAAPGGGSGGAASTPTESPGSGSTLPNTGSGGSGGNSPAPAPGSSSSNGGAAPYPAYTTLAEQCPGPACRAAPSSNPTGVTYGNTSNIEPFNGGAATTGHLGLLSSFSLAMVIAGLAFAL